jgi:hypothetical protein
MGRFMTPWCGSRASSATAWSTAAALCGAVALLGGCELELAAAQAELGACADPAAELCAAEAPPTAFRISRLWLRDPHIFVNLLGCRDLTDEGLFGMSVNSELDNALNRDKDGDGLRDLSFVLQFSPLAPEAESTPLELIEADCPVGNPTSCRAQDGGDRAASTATNQTQGLCLAPLPGTTGSYSPAISGAAAPCFESGSENLSFELAGIHMSLTDAQVGATYAANGGALLNGVLRGFVSEAAAAETVLPSYLPIVGGAPLTSVLRGGTACQAGDDRDTDPSGASGWYFYLNFLAEPVPFRDVPGSTQN